MCFRGWWQVATTVFCPTPNLRPVFMIKVRQSTQKRLTGNDSGMLIWIAATIKYNRSSLRRRRLRSKVTFSGWHLVSSVDGAATTQSLINKNGINFLGTIH